jgi:hypothetical protein
MSLWEARTVFDIVCVVLILVFFAVSAWFVRGCDHLAE